MTVDKCNRCGACCTWQLEGISEPETCKYLMRINETKTYCRIYKNQARIGMKLGVWQGIPIRCTERKNDNVIQHGKAMLRIHSGCPYNP